MAITVRTPRSYRTAIRNERDSELLERVRNAAIVDKRAEEALNTAIAEAYFAGVPMTQIARSWGKTEGAVRMFLKRRYGRRGGPQ